MRPDLPTRRSRRLLTVAAATALISVAGLVASAWVKSPAQLAAETAPPPPSVITAPVVRQVLSSTVIARGSFSSGRQFHFTPASVAATAGNPGAASLIVTGVYVHRGERVKPGQVLAEVSGRPVFALHGSFPAYRDMVPGESGPDIAELQSALGALGFPDGSDTPGYFGSGTEAAVADFYRAIGYPEPVSAGGTGAATGGSGKGGSSGGGGGGKGSTPAVIMPMSEVWFIRSFPAHVSGPLPHVGDSVQQPLLTISAGGVKLTGEFDPTQAPLLKVGMQVKVQSDLTGYSGEGTVAGLGGETVARTGPNAGVPYVPVRIKPSRHWPLSLNGQDVQLTLIAASTGSPVLAVPEAAITTSANGQTTVTVEELGHTQRLVRVRTGAAAGGLVAVTPAAPSALRPGMRVVVGAASAGRP